MDQHSNQLQEAKTMLNEMEAKHRAEVENLKDQVKEKAESES